MMIPLVLPLLQPLQLPLQASGPPLALSLSIFGRRPGASAGGGQFASKYADALADARGEDGWQFVLSERGVRVWKRLEEAGSESTAAPMAVKASVEASVPARHLTDLILTRDYDLARKFNPTLEGGSDLEWLDGERERISHVKTKPVLILRPRDFVLRVRRETAADGTELVLNDPTTHADAPVAQPFIRGTISGLHLIEPLGEAGAPRCRYTTVHTMDPAGAVPLAVVNWFALRRPMQYMSALRRLAEDTLPARSEEDEIEADADAEADVAEAGVEAEAGARGRLVRGARAVRGGVRRLLGRGKPM